jgi:hypothetical protein
MDGKNVHVVFGLLGRCARHNTEWLCWKAENILKALEAVSAATDATKSAAADYRLTLAADTPHLLLSRSGYSEYDFDLVPAVAADLRPALVLSTGRNVGL